MTNAEPTTKKLRVYGTDYIDVEMQIDANNLTSAQQKLAEQFRLNEYVDDTYINKPEEGKQWIKDILNEIINKDCRTDKDAILKAPCPNYQAYLLHLAINFTKSGSRKLPHVKKVISLKDKKARDKARKNGLNKFGNITVKIYIPIDDILGSGSGLGSDSGSGSGASSGLDMGSGGDPFDELRRKQLLERSPKMRELYAFFNPHSAILDLFDKSIQIEASHIKGITELTAR